MKTRISWLCVLLLAGVYPFDFVPTVLAEDSPATATAVAPKKFDPKDLDGLRGARNEQVVVEGTIARSGESKSKTVRYLNFSNDYREAVTLVFFLNKGGDLFAMEKLHKWIGKKVRVNGKVTEYGSTVQIEIEKWDQIKEIP
jgi:hypothetical protein